MIRSRGSDLGFSTVEVDRTQQYSTLALQRLVRYRGCHYGDVFGAVVIGRRSQMLRNTRARSGGRSGIVASPGADLCDRTAVSRRPCVLLVGQSTSIDSILTTGGPQGNDGLPRAGALLSLRRLISVHAATGRLDLAIQQRCQTNPDTLWCRAYLSRDPPSPSRSLDLDRPRSLSVCHLPWPSCAAPLLSFCTVPWAPAEKFFRWRRYQQLRTIEV